MADKENQFSRMYKIDVSEYMDKKGKFNYLSWPYAVKTLREHDETATWRVLRFDGLPYMSTPLGYFVEVEVTCFGVPLSQIHPVLDNNNRPIAQPTSFDINRSIQRALVKAIALHGLGLYIFAGEDLPESHEEEPLFGDPGARQIGQLIEDLLKVSEPEAFRQTLRSRWPGVNGDYAAVPKSVGENIVATLTQWKKAKEAKAHA